MFSLCTENMQNFQEFKTQRFIFDLLYGPTFLFKVHCPAIQELLNNKNAHFLKINNWLLLTFHCCPYEEDPNPRRADNLTWRTHRRELQTLPQQQTFTIRHNWLGQDCQGKLERGRRTKIPLSPSFMWWPPPPFLFSSCKGFNLQRNMNCCCWVPG